MAVQRRRVEPLHVVERDGRVDEEAEQARAHQVPEGDGHEEVDGPAVGGEPALGPRQADVLPDLEAHQHQRHHLQRAEHRPQRQHGGRRAREVQVVEGADDAAGQEHRWWRRARRWWPLRTARRRSRTKRKAITTVAKTSKKPSTQRCTTHQRQYSDQRQVRGAAVHEPGAVEERDGHRGEEEEAEQGTGVLVRLLVAGRREPGAGAAPEDAAGAPPTPRRSAGHRAGHEEEPDEEADEEEELPEAPQVHVLVALVAEPVPAVPAQALHHARATARPSSRAR